MCYNHTTGSSTTSLTATTTPSSSQGKKVGRNVWKRPKILLSPDKLDTTTASGNDHDEEEMELEDFEINASPYVTKKRGNENVSFVRGDIGSM